MNLEQLANAKITRPTIGDLLRYDGKGWANSAIGVIFVGPLATLNALYPPGIRGRLAEVTDGIRGIWKDTGTAWVSVTGRVDVRDFGASPSASAATNAVAFQAAIDSGAAEVVVPESQSGFDYSTGLSIDRAIRFRGMGSCGAESNATGQPGVSTTKLNYSGTGVAITIVGSGTEGKENIHLDNFSLWGTSNADGGILFGTGAIGAVYSSLRNIHCRGFTKVGGYGLKLGKSQSSIFENVFLQSNYDGLLAQGTNTNHEFRGVRAYTNTRNGFRLLDLQSCRLQISTESNDYEGLYLYSLGAQGLDFFGYRSEDNCRVAGNAPIYISGASGSDRPIYIKFFGGAIYDYLLASNRAVDMDYAERVTFHDTTFSTYLTGFVRLTSNTLNCDLFATWNDACLPSNVSGNHITGMRVHSGATPGRYTTTITDGQELLLPFTGGIILVTDKTNNKSAIMALNGTANTTSELSDPNSGFATTSTAGMIGLYYSSGYRINNNGAGASVVIEMAAVNIGL